MNEDLKAQYQMDVESGYPEPWKLWVWRSRGGWNPCNKTWGRPFHDDNFIYSRLPDADQIILGWQKAKYQEDCTWHPRPKTLWQIWEGGAWKTFDDKDFGPKFYPSERYRRRPDAPTKEEWEAEQETAKSFESAPNHKAPPLPDKCATCRHTYEAKP